MLNTEPRRKRSIDIDICGAIATNGEVCEQPKGWRTNHPGEGRCTWHENTVNGSEISPASLRIPALEERMQRFINDSNILSLDQEIALNRSYVELLNNYIQILKDENIKKIIPEQSQISYTFLTDNIVKITNNIGKLVKTKSEIELGRKYVVHINIFHSILTMVADIINNNIEDIETKKKITQQLTQIHLPSPEL